MCRSIKRLYNLDPEVEPDELYAASRQFVRKISGMTKPSKANEEAFEQAIQDIAAISGELMDRLETSADPLDREALAARARERWQKRAARA